MWRQWRIFYCKSFDWKKGSERPCVADVDREPRQGAGYIKWILCDATECQLTAANFPDGSATPYDPDNLPPDGLPERKRAISKKCYTSFTTGGNATLGGYTFRNVKSLEIDYDLITYCRCNNQTNKGSFGFKDALK
ncbi:hypothetical protein [uncultured Dokdonia sp.]|uniref:hypothetical protein n=1 Tax=uncultured Dokdonia sp. TaxID=575653 RepID=UPI002628593A|nr:hypothetical protein [uncultured Dokdonia sp.]